MGVRSVAGAALAAILVAVPAVTVLMGAASEDAAEVTGPVGAVLPPEGSSAASTGEAAPSGQTTTPGPVDRPRAPIGDFLLSTRQLHPIADGLRPYQDGVVWQFPFGLVDGEGVRMFRLDKDPTIYNHPIAQAQYALRALETYRITGKKATLDVAALNAQRIADRAFEIDGAWYFPYDFDFDLFRNGRGVLRAPWASGMSSGQALSVFVRLYEQTGEQKWRDYADKTFAAFLQAPDGRGFFVSWVDPNGLLWLEEYSRYPVTDSERVLNGHMWSMFGIWDYWNLNDQDHADAERLWRGALLTVEKTAWNGFRQRGDVSLYSLWQKKPAWSYHQHHQHQFLMLWRMSHDSVWVTRAATLRWDYPEWRDAKGFATITPRTTRAYKLDDRASNITNRTMKVTQTKVVNITRTTGASYDRRGQIAGGPNALRLSSGYLAGWWVEEGFGKAWSREPVELHPYEPHVELKVQEPRKVAVYSYDAVGNRTGHKFVTLQPGRTYPMRASAMYEGRISWAMTGAGLDGYWLPDQSGLVVVREPGWS